MKNWTIRRRIIAGFGLCLALITVLTVTMVINMRAIKARLVDVTEESIPGLVTSAEINARAQMIQLLVLQHITAKTAEEKTAYEAEMKRLADENLALLEQAGQSFHSDEDKANFQRIKEARQDYVNARPAVLELSRTGKTDEAIALNTKALQPLYLKFRDATTVMFHESAAFGKTAATSIEDVTNRGSTTSILIACVALTACLAAGFFITRGINRVLSTIASELGDASAQVSSASTQVSSSSQMLAEGSSEQAASLEETSASLEEINSMTKRNAEHAQNAKSLAQDTRTAAEQGNHQMDEMVAAMNAIQDSSGNISKIIKTIDEIAFQTNILALNAAVEAARAGEAGMGFAVVAEEVRNLAQRSAQAARETAEKIDDSINKSTAGVALSSRVADSLKHIATKAREVDALVGEIATASHEQTSGIGQVNVALSQMDKVTQSNASGAEETASAAAELTAQAKALGQSVNELLQLVQGKSDVGSPAEPVRAQVRAAPMRSVPAKTRLSAKSTVKFTPNRSRPAANLPSLKASTVGPTNGNGNGRHPANGSDDISLNFKDM